MSLPRPVRAPKADDDVWAAAGGREWIDVLVDDPAAPVRTGLLDQFGVPIMRVPTRHKIGF